MDKLSIRTPSQFDALTAADLPRLEAERAELYRSLTMFERDHPHYQDKIHWLTEQIVYIRAKARDGAE